MLFAAVVVAWVASEVILGVMRHAGARGERRDRGSLALLWVALSAGSMAAVFLRRTGVGRIDGGWAYWTGLALIVIGIVIRWTAILTLRRYFTIDVVIQEGHELIDRGIYSVVRHPSYSGAIVSFIGLGMALRNWLSVAALTVIGFAALSYRIGVEERALIEHFGDRYRDYARRTKRLIPGIY
jgi:protein-S-isoprenylcysteine O-methyltransferase Ste14